ncbi:MAG TPA: ABC transporter substrate-binding protein [Candidatus Elarobacter sp.]|jgi:putative ABC transport system substrate-binding protein
MVSKLKIALILCAALFLLPGPAAGAAQHAPRIVAIATLMSHPALDQLIASMKSRVSAQRSGGSPVRFVEWNANQQVNLLPTIVDQVISRKPDVIVAVTTPVAQAFRRKVDKPFVFAAVTDPVGAGVVTSLNKPGPWVSGTSDAWPYHAQLALIREMMPRAVHLGVLYNPGEAASQYGIKQIRRYAPEFGFRIVEGPVASVNEELPVAQSLVDRTDALFLSSDNTVIGGAAGAISVAISKKKPLFAGDSGTVQKGGLATVSVGYAKLGDATGEIVNRFLAGDGNVPVIVGRDADIYINLAAAKAMGVSVSARLRARAKQLYSQIAR